MSMPDGTKHLFSSLILGILVVIIGEMYVYSRIPSSAQLNNAFLPADKTVADILKREGVVQYKKEYYSVEIEGVVAKISTVSAKPGSPPGISINTPQGEKLISFSTDTSNGNTPPYFYKMMDGKAGPYSFDKIREGERVIVTFKVNVKNPKVMIPVITVL